MKTYRAYYLYPQYYYVPVWFTSSWCLNPVRIWVEVVRIRSLLLFVNLEFCYLCCCFAVLDWLKLEWWNVWTFLRFIWYSYYFCGFLCVWSRIGKKKKKLGFFACFSRGCSCVYNNLWLQSLPINVTIYRGPIPRVGSDEVALFGQKRTKNPLLWAGLKRTQKGPKNTFKNK